MIIGLSGLIEMQKHLDNPELSLVTFSWCETGQVYVEGV